MDKEILTVKEAAEYLGVRREFIQRLLYSGELEGSKIGRLWRIQKSDIIKYLEKNKNVPQP